MKLEIIGWGISPKSSLKSWLLPKKGEAQNRGKSSSNPKSKDKAKHGKTTTKKVKHKFGISVSRVAARGKVPTCKYCHATFERDQLRIVNKYGGTNESNQYRCSVDHYHLNCIGEFTTQEKQQLKSIIKKSKDVTDQDKRIFFNSVESVLRSV